MFLSGQFEMFNLEVQHFEIVSLELPCFEVTIIIIYTTVVLLTAHAQTVTHGIYVYTASEGQCFFVLVFERLRHNIMQL